jgi:hypothetical protein
MNEPYQHKSCLGCGKRIPRWVNGEETPISKVFCDKGCAQYARRQKSKLTPQAREATNAKARPVNQGFPAPVFATEGRLRQWEPCAASSAARFCDSRCESYVPYPPRKVDGEWHIVAGPIDCCVGCGLGITPTKLWGHIAGWAGKDGLYCTRECRKAGGAAFADATAHARRVEVIESRFASKRAMAPAANREAPTRCKSEVCQPGVNYTSHANLKRAA